MKCPQCGAGLECPVSVPAPVYQVGESWAVLRPEGIVECPWCRFTAHVDYWVAAEDPEKRAYQNTPFTPKTHWIKAEPKHFYAVMTGNKTFEIRKNDRGYRVGHCIILKMWDAERGYYKRNLALKILSVTDFPDGLRPGWVVMGVIKI